MNENLQMLVICLPFMALGLGALLGLCTGTGSSIGEFLAGATVLCLVLGVAGLAGVIIALVGGFIQGVQP